MHWAAEWIYARCLGLLINYFNNLAWISVERCQARLSSGLVESDHVTWILASDWSCVTRIRLADYGIILQVLALVTWERRKEGGWSRGQETLSGPSLGSLGARPGLTISRSGPPNPNLCQCGQEAGTGARRTYSLVHFKSLRTSDFRHHSSDIIWR